MKNIMLIMLLILVSTLYAQYLCPWSVISGGSGSITSTDYRAQTTVIQTATGALTGINILAFIGFWQRELGMPGIAEEKTEEISDINKLLTKLYNAKPNPFKTQTAIRFSLPAESKVKLLIYDISGRLVRTLINEEEVSGVYKVIWNSKNDRNQTVSAGIYFYKFQTPNYTETKKLLLIE